MSTATHVETIDMTRPGIPMSRLIKVELRKLVDTRAGMWLLISIAALSALVMVILIWALAANDESATFKDFVGAMSTPMGILLPVLGIMSVTSEWGQRTGLVTFTLEPRRSRVVIAKLVSAVVVAVVGLVISIGLGALGNVLFGLITGDDTVWNAGGLELGGFFLANVIGLLTGFAFGMLFMNTAAAIVLFFVYSFVLPGLFAAGAALMDWFKDLRPWIDFASAQGPLFDATMTGRDWAQFAVSGLIWFVLPLAVGIWRLLRAEVK
jgi:ABC-type transport system involved in multi-copper enzyme maturation permease subunit